MCGVQFQASANPRFRRAASSKDLVDSELLAGAGLGRSTKSYADLSAALLDGKQLSTLRLIDGFLLCRGTASTDSSNDTGRSSPISAFEQVLRSRSPSAVLLTAEASTHQSPQQQRDGSGGDGADAGVDVDVDVDSVAAAAAQEVAPPAPASPQAAATRSASLLPRCDAEFDQSSASDAVLDAPAAQCTSGQLPAQIREGSTAAAAAGRSGSSSAADAAQLSPAASAAAGAPRTQAPPPAAAATAAAPPQQQCAFMATAASSSFFTSSSSSAAPTTLSPFARLAHQPPSMLLSQAPSMLHQPVPPPPLGGSVGSSTGSSPTATHSRTGSGISLELRRSSLDSWGTSPHLSEGHAAEELFYRLNHARQTVDFVKRQATAFSALNKAAMGVWEALELLNTLREYESALLGDADGEPTTPDMPLLEHALQCAEACRAAFPDEDYMHLAGLLAPLGKLLAHAKFGAEPQWAICGETFPVGCRFHPSVRHSQYFSANPDRRKRLYSSPTGVYREGCGLGGVLMSWGAGEYLHLVLRLNRVPLPPEALFCLRHQKLQCVFRAGTPYSELLSEFDRVQLPRLAKFQQQCTYRRMPRAQPLMVPAAASAVGGSAAAAAMAAADAPLQVEPALRQYYDMLIAKYIPQGTLLW